MSATRRRQPSAWARPRNPAPAHSESTTGLYIVESSTIILIRSRKGGPRVKRLLGLFLALAILLPVFHTLFPAADAAPAPHAHAATTASPAAADSHCPPDVPTKPQCSPSADPQLNIAQIAPRPDAAGTFGALPATLGVHSRISQSRLARGPDLHALSISRT